MARNALCGLRQTRAEEEEAGAGEGKIAQAANGLPLSDRLAAAGDSGHVRVEGAAPQGSGTPVTMLRGRSSTDRQV